MLQIAFIAAAASVRQSLCWIKYSPTTPRHLIAHSGSSRARDRPGPSRRGQLQGTLCFRLLASRPSGLRFACPVPGTGGWPRSLGWCKMSWEPAQATDGREHVWGSPLAPLGRGLQGLSKCCRAAPCNT